MQNIQAGTEADTQEVTQAPATLKLSTKLAYSSADLAGALSYIALNTWLLYFLVNIAGLPPLQAGAVFVLGRLVDAVLDPVIGTLSDRLKPKVGRLIFLRWGAVPAGASFVLLFLLPLSAEAKFFTALLGLILYSVIYTFINMPYLALLPELAPGYDERTVLNAYRLTFAMVANLIAVAAPPVIVVAVTGSVELASSPPAGWLVMAVIFGLIMSAALFITGFGVREPRTTVPSTAPSTVPRSSLLKEVRTTFGTHGFWQVFVMFVTVTMGFMIANSVLPFYLESALSLSAAEQPVVLLTLFGTALLTFPLWTFVSSRIGKKGALTLGLLIEVASLLLLVSVVPAGSVSGILLGVVALNAFGLAAVTLFPWAMLPDVIEFDELASGRRREGLFYALFTFGQKVAGSAGVFANAIIIAAFNYQQGSSEQTSETLRGLSLMIGPVAASVFGLAILFVWLYPITRKTHRAAQDALAQKI